MVLLSHMKLEPNHISDEDLVKLFQFSGDMSYFEQIFDRYKTKIYRKVYLYTKNEMDSEDVTQDIFIKLYHNLPKFQFRAQFRTWLYRLVVNTCLDFLKQQKRRTYVSLDDQKSEKPTPEKIDIRKIQAVRAAFIAVVDSSHHDEVSTILHQLKPNEAHLLQLRFVDDLKLEQIAKVLQIPTNTVKQRLHRVRKKFITLYEKNFQNSKRTYQNE